MVAQQQQKLELCSWVSDFLLEPQPQGGRAEGGRGFATSRQKLGGRGHDKIGGEV